MRRMIALFVLLLMAAIAVSPLLRSGCSCGHDFAFHLQSWLDAAQQFRHHTLYPRWAFSAAYNAGEPRFMFYPPLSWALGGLLTMLFPIGIVPVVYTLLALFASAFTMRRLAVEFGSRSGAIIAAALYLANPYMLFNAYERTAYAELLAAAWLPLLFLALLRNKPRILEVAVPMALLWLTNAPAAVIGSYALAAITFIRIVPFLRALAARQLPAAVFLRPIAAILQPVAGGTALGMALAAFYLVPAAFERRFVQIAMAIIPNMRFEDNFLFRHTGDAPHDAVLHTASLLSVEILVATLIVILILRRRMQTARRRGVIPANTSANTAQPVLLPLALLIAFFLFPLSAFFWKHLPELAFLQFPWRLLSLLSVLFVLAYALLLRRTQLGFGSAIVGSLSVVLLGISTTLHTFRQPCDAADLPAARAQQFAAHHGVEPTDEYTPALADNDLLRRDDPAFWLAADPAAFAPASHPSAPTSTDASADPASGEPAPLHLAVTAPAPTFLVLNLRAYPNWIASRTSAAEPSPTLLPLIPRDDGLIAFALPAGASTIDIAWHTSRDEQLGAAISALALLLCAALLVRSRRPPRKHFIERRVA